MFKKINHDLGAVYKAGLNCGSKFKLRFWDMDVIQSSIKIY